MLTETIRTSSEVSTSAPVPPSQGRRVFRGYLTLRDVAELRGLDWSPAVKQQLWRALRRRESETGVTLLLKPDGERTLKTTVELLRDYMPEWFSRRDRAAEKLANRFAKYDERFAVQQLKTNALAARIRALEATVERLEEHLGVVTDRNGP